ncbi:MAG: hypothetical protein RL095_1822 [Verrucomicrobiota bacterium]|jgi:S1-C subfamily serine protease
MRRIVRLLAAALLLASCATRESGPVANAIVDDRQIMETIEGGIDKLDPASFVAPATLLAQARSRKVADLPRPALSDRRAAQPLDRLYADLADSSVVVARLFKCDKCPKWHSAPASGVIIGSDGLIATNFHVIEGRGSQKSEQLVVILRDGRIFPIQEVLAADKEADCALIRIKAAGLKAAPLNPRSPAGSRVIAITHPAMHYWSLTEGVVSRHFLEPPRGTDGRRVARLAITADFAKGSSGGPIFNTSGELVGIVTYTQSIYYDSSHGQETNFQMTFKTCVLSQSLLELYRPLELKGVRK